MTPDELTLHKQFGARPFDPAQIEFEAVPRTGCASCIFAGQRTDVCRAATAESLRRGGEDCDAGFIYVLKRKDPRQLTIE